MKHIFLFCILFCLFNSSLSQAQVDPEEFIRPLVELKYIELNSGIISIIVKVQSIDEWTSLWVSIKNPENGWTIANERGTDTYSVMINEENMSTEYKCIYPSLLPNRKTSFIAKYYSPLEDTIGAHINQGFKINIQLRDPLFTNEITEESMI